MTTAAVWRVQLWLSEHLIEEHVAPAELAQEYANVIQLRIAGLPGRQLRCIPTEYADPAKAVSPSRTGETRINLGREVVVALATASPIRPEPSLPRPKAPPQTSGRVHSLQSGRPPAVPPRQ
ncbi:hypothetical protein [Kribbella sp. NPDC049227]|uniref:hypothetical protein n=1 Tax=Kribbella sp. NPDC049227 TaxID=3364113 RepID=UPI00372179C5